MLNWKLSLYKSSYKIYISTFVTMENITHFKLC